MNHIHCRILQEINFPSLVIRSHRRQNNIHSTLHSLFYLETALHVSVGTSTQPQEHKKLYLQHLVFVTP